jgi:hypothetical protein
VTRRTATLALLAALVAGTSACSQTPPPPKPTARPLVPEGPRVPDVTSDRGHRVLAPSPVGQLAPEDPPVAPGTKR